MRYEWLADLVGLARSRGTLIARVKGDVDVPNLGCACVHAPDLAVHVCTCLIRLCMCASPGSDAVPLPKSSWLGTLGRDMWILGAHPVFVLNMLAYCPVQGAFGSYIFWGPKVSLRAPIVINLL